MNNVCIFERCHLKIVFIVMHIWQKYIKSVQKYMDLDHLTITIQQSWRHVVPFLEHVPASQSELHKGMVVGLEQINSMSLPEPWFQLYWTPELERSRTVSQAFSPNLTKNSLNPVKTFPELWKLLSSKRAANSMLIWCLWNGIFRKHMGLIGWWRQTFGHIVHVLQNISDSQLSIRGWTNQEFINY